MCYISKTVAIGESSKLIRERLKIIKRTSYIFIAWWQKRSWSAHCFLCLLHEASGTAAILLHCRIWENIFVSSFAILWRSLDTSWKTLTFLSKLLTIKYLSVLITFYLQYHRASCLLIFIHPVAFLCHIEIIKLLNDVCEVRQHNTYFLPISM